MKGSLEAFRVGSVLGVGNGRVGGSNLENDGSFFKGEGGLGSEFGGEGVVPWEDNADFAEPEFQEFELTKVLV